MDPDIVEGLPTTEELAAEPTPQAIPEPVSTVMPAAPVDAASVEPEPQTVASVVQETPPVIEAASIPPGKVAPTTVVERAIASPPPQEKPAAIEAVPKEEVAKSVDDKTTTAPPASGFQLPEGPRVDVSAATVARMMGIASTSDLRVLEGRIDLLTSKVAAILTKMDRCLSMFSSIPTASDIGRLEVQVAAVKSMMKELLDSVGAPVSGAKEQADREASLEQSRKLREGIKTNTES
jgi:hypothetical protein